MKLEIIKETDNARDLTYYWTAINGKKTTCHTRLKSAKDALYKLEMTYTQGKPNIEEEIIFSKEIELPNES